MALLVVALRPGPRLFAIAAIANHRVAVGVAMPDEEHFAAVAAVFCSPCVGPAHAASLGIALSGPAALSLGIALFAPAAKARSNLKAVSFLSDSFASASNLFT